MDLVDLAPLNFSALGALHTDHANPSIRVHTGVGMRFLCIRTLPNCSRIKASCYYLIVYSFWAEINFLTLINYLDSHNLHGDKKICHINFTSS